MRRSAFKLKDKLLETQDKRRVYVVRGESLTFNPSAFDKVINWGNSKFPLWPLNYTAFNDPSDVMYSVNKLEAFKRFELCGVSHPEWSTELAPVIEWMKNGDIVLCRHYLNAFGGKGIELIDVNKGDKLPPARLYVKYKKKKTEFRVHVFNGEVIDVQQKKRRKGFEGRDNQIRNYANGWVYCRDDIEVPAMVTSEAIKAVNCLGLCFGAADVIWNDKEQRAYVLEVNTAPGLEGTTLENYANAFTTTVQD
jgi:glutathione synthase/RimK-type ligase-like ATP-grasp enzyme